MEHSNGNYFLRPDRILGCFQINHNARPKLTLKLVAELEIEKNREKQLVEKLEKSAKKHVSNAARIDNVVEMLWTSLSEVKIPTVTHNTAASSSASSISKTAKRNNSIGQGLESLVLAAVSPLQFQRSEKESYNSSEIGGGDVDDIDIDIEMTHLGVGTSGAYHNDDDGTSHQQNPMTTRNSLKKMTSSQVTSLHAPNRLHDPASASSSLLSSRFPSNTKKEEMKDNEVPLGLGGNDEDVGSML
jgi:hypothetical protein